MTAHVQCKSCKIDIRTIPIHPPPRKSQPSGTVPIGQRKTVVRSFQLLVKQNPGTATIQYPVTYSIPRRSAGAISHTYPHCIAYKHTSTLESRLSQVCSDVFSEYADHHQGPSPRPHLSPPTHSDLVHTYPYGSVAILIFDSLNVSRHSTPPCTPGLVPSF
jgi:hypothetical protein